MWTRRSLSWLLRFFRQPAVVTNRKAAPSRPTYSSITRHHLAAVTRVLPEARAKCSPEFLNDGKELRATARPLVVTTTRLDNRVWIEQREGPPALFGRLRQSYPHLGLILDGLSSDTAKGWTTMRMALDAELEIANHVRAARRGHAGLLQRKAHGRRKHRPGRCVRHVHRSDRVWHDALPVAIEPAAAGVSNPVL